MLTLCILYLKLLLVACATSPQQPFSVSVSENWDLNAPAPNENVTDNLIFDTTNALLQHWPNTRYRNGHTLVPGHIPFGTLLYHGRAEHELPTSPDWTAVDPEHSYIFARDREDATKGWHLTLVTTRPLNILYFDGSSASKMPYGSMDSQDILTWGKVIPSRFFNERERIQLLCDWGKGLGVDGFVRMEMDFEVMLCDFTPDGGGVEVVSFLNVDNRQTIPGGYDLPPDVPFQNASSNYPPSPPQTNDSYLYIPPPIFVPGRDTFQAVIQAGHWHNHFPGDTRIKLDLTRLISFYDTSLVPSLVEKRRNVGRWFHRIENISEIDTVGVLKKLESSWSVPLDNTTTSKSGVDWQTLFHVVVDRFSSRLEMLEYTLFNQAISGGNTDQVTMLNDTMAIRQGHHLLSTILRPYILKSTYPPDDDTADSTSASKWAEPVYQFCATTHTQYLHHRHSTLTDSEKLLLGSLRGVEKEICRTVTRMWAQIPPSKSQSNINNVHHHTHPYSYLLNEWKSETRRLMDWLDWGVWVKCKPGCSFEEECYLPTWPFFNHDGPKGPGGPPPPTKHINGIQDSLDSTEEGEEDWMKPTPRCVRRLAFYKYRVDINQFQNNSMNNRRQSPWY